jgi:hypothetical protein
LSARYSNSPELHLTVGESALRQCLLIGFMSCALVALLLVHRAGFSLAAAVLSLSAAASFARLWRDPDRGVYLRWRSGQWTLVQDEEVLTITVLPGSTWLPWVAVVAWRESWPGRRRGRLWVFRGSVPTDAMRRLRSRLVLER